jgi:hypothetical protein
VYAYLASSQHSVLVQSGCNNVGCTLQLQQLEPFHFANGRLKKWLPHVKGEFPGFVVYGPYRSPGEVESSGNYRFYDLIWQSLMIGSETSGALMRAWLVSNSLGGPGLGPSEESRSELRRVKLSCLRIVRERV